MSTAIDVDAAAGVVTLSRADAPAAEQVAATLLAVAGELIDDPSWIAEAALRWHDLPESLRRPLLAYRRNSGRTGALLVRGLSVDESSLPETPMVSGSAQREATLPAALLMLVAAAFGDPIAFREEKSGAMVQNVVPVPGREDVQGNEGSVLLTFHNENAFHEHRPDYVLLCCLRADHDRIAGLRTASIRQVHGMLTEWHREALFRKDFVTAPPPSFGAALGESEPHAVLSGALEDPDVMVDFAATKPLTEQAGDALVELQSLFAANALTHYLTPGDLAIVDNRVTVHGRTGFAPRYDGRDRWLQRTTVTQNLRRSRLLRADDGHVLGG
ncbi:TauD/TfdA family dioxygenase [Actinophytocola oryzae]|uniref:L-asparagine oxygenase n=1 Tax=Actinophytocola oryzae TaxID=502181 RepID=A0A4R7VKH1_9PSEU|nr:TauD/TfdA family dioxygenase [Actinophytocola oryzae]TDV49745.1 L-asparagine oxygenase [Actinophytocola oryzae]